jgi:serine protease Do
MAIGNPFGLGGNSVTVGVVSFKGRPLNLNERQQGTPIDMIQTDASINPGNSGGPLLNTRGEVIGINTMIVTSGLSQSAGVGFAVPVNVAKEILPQLRDTGKVVRGWLGVQIVPVTEDAAKTFGLEDRRGAAIVDVTEGSPADKAGLKPEDVVVGVDGRRVEDNNDLSSYVAGKAPGTSVNLRVLRQGAEQAITVRLGTFPDEGDARVVAAAETRGQLGMTLRDMTAELAEHLELPRGSRGVVVTEVEPGEPADDAGLRQGDVILRVNGTRVESVTEFDRALEAVRGDGLARLLVRRGSGNFFVILRFK